MIGGPMQVEGSVPVDQTMRQPSNASNDNDEPMAARDSDSPCSVDSSDSLSNKAKEVRKNNNIINNNVSELVAKSKKAASSLWTLLHAKNCRLGVNMCSHVGCPEAKLMYLHLKTCSAVLLEPCPSQHPGCQDARKLLAHYRRCRDIRARQAQNPATRSQQHVCLVCSLVARHAKFTLDRSTATPGRSSSSPKVGSTFIPSLILKEESFDDKSNGPASSTTRLSQSLDENRGFLSSRPTSASQRFAFSRPANGGGSGSARGFQALQAAVSCAIGSNSSSTTTTTTLESIGEQHELQSKSGRPRAESLDARSNEFSDEEKQQDGAKSMSYLYLAAVESLEEEPATNASAKTPQSRRRSQSCSVPSASYSASVDSMLQKPMGEELQNILGGDA